MSNQTTPQASEPSLPWKADEASCFFSTEIAYPLCQIVVYDSSNCSIATVVGASKEQVESRARLVVQAVNERAEMLALLGRALKSVDCASRIFYGEGIDNEDEVKLALDIQSALSRSEQPTQPKDV